MSRVRVAFFGTPEFASIHLEQLLQDEHYEVVGIVTQPDRPAGRSLKLSPSPVKSLALKHNLPVLTPEKLKDDRDAIETLKSWTCEVGIVVAFGQILSQECLDLFPLGCVNVHGSLLPIWRGAAPIQRSIEAGDFETGVALQKMVKKLDAGAVIGIRKIIITDNMGARELHDHLARLGCELITVELMDYVRGNLAPVEQDESKVTYAKKIEKSESEVNWSMMAWEIHCRARGFELGPGVFVKTKNGKLKLTRTAAVRPALDTLQLTVATEKLGQIVQVDKESIFVQTSKGLLQIFEVQPESKSKMKVIDYLNGIKLKASDYL